MLSYVFNACYKSNNHCREKCITRLTPLNIFDWPSLSKKLDTSYKL